MYSKKHLPDIEQWWRGTACGADRAIVDEDEVRVVARETRNWSHFVKFSTKNFSKVDINGCIFSNFPFSGGQHLGGRPWRRRRGLSASGRARAAPTPPRAVSRAIQALPALWRGTACGAHCVRGTLRAGHTACGAEGCSGGADRSVVDEDEVRVIAREPRRRHPPRFHLPSKKRLPRMDGKDRWAERNMREL